MFTKKKESEELETPKMRISHCFQIQIFGKKKKKNWKDCFRVWIFWYLFQVISFKPHIPTVPGGAEHKVWQQRLHPTKDDEL